MDIEESGREVVDGSTVGAQDEAGLPGHAVLVLGRRVVRFGVGVVTLGIDQVGAAFQRVVDRGEQVETSVRASVSHTGERATAAVSSRLAAVLNKAPGVRLTYRAPKGAAQPGPEAGVMDAAPAPLAPNGEGAAQ